MSGHRRRPPRRARGRTSLRAARPKSPDILVDVISHQKLLRVSRTRIATAVRFVMHAEDVRHAAIDVALVDDATIRNVHKRFLGSDTPTDVMTFPMSDSVGLFAGEIVLSVETAIREAPTFGLSPADEVLLYVIHGSLHLCGYDDRHATDARKMRKRQTELFRDLTER